ncbi:MAG: hypothetical protein PUH10_03505 [Erysipelotrichaceae bacterium]|nr:hypothetical protein [Erysipelotrichaceae bacterium]
MNLDTIAKKINANKNVIAIYAKNLLDEFKDYDKETIKKCIESIEVDSNMIVGYNTEINLKGKIILDLLVGIRDPKTNDLIYLNIEMQATEKKLDYPIEKRGEYYGSNLIVNQKDINFKNDHYEDIKKVYSIWIILDCFQYRDKNSIVAIDKHPRILTGKPNLIKKNYDNQTQIYIFMDEESINQCEEEYKEVIMIIYELFIQKQDLTQKKEILSKYGIIDIEEQEMMTMCNLSYYFELKGEERGLSQGIEIGRSEGIDIGRTAERKETIQNLMSSSNQSFDKVYDLLNYDENEKEKYRKLIAN